MQKEIAMNEVATNNDADTRISMQAAAASSNATTEADAGFAQDPAIRFFPVSEEKLYRLYLLSFGLYGIYWFYQNWKLQQPLMDKKIYPLLRAIFSIFFTHSLFGRISQQASRLERKQHFSSTAYATFFVVAVIASHFSDLFFTGVVLPLYLTESLIITTSLVLFVVSVFPLLKAQAVVNRINHDIPGHLNHHYSLLNYATIIAGIFAWLMIALGLLSGFAGITIPQQSV